MTFWDLKLWHLYTFTMFTPHSPFWYHMTHTHRIDRSRLECPCKPIPIKKTKHGQHCHDYLQKKVAIQARSIGAGGIFHIFNKFTYKILNLEVPPSHFFLGSRKNYRQKLTRGLKSEVFGTPPSPPWIKDYPIPFFKFCLLFKISEKSGSHFQKRCYIKYASISTQNVLNCNSIKSHLKYQ